MSDNQWWQTEENDSVATSPKVWRPISNSIGGFDLDPAAGCEPTPIAENRYTPEDDGLTSEWFGNVWLNPPFSEKTPWYKRLVAQYNSDNVNRAVAIATVDPSASWFHNWFSTADVICYHEDRNLYLDNGDSPTFSTQIGVWNSTEELNDVLHGMGTLVEPVEDTAQTTL
jgi:hypothetical protein